MSEKLDRYREAALALSWLKHLSICGVHKDGPCACGFVDEVERQLRAYLPETWDVGDVTENRRLSAENDGLRGDLDALRSRVEELEGLLEEYGHHIGRCPQAEIPRAWTVEETERWLDTNEPPDCECGLDAALKEPTR